MRIYKLHDDVMTPDCGAGVVWGHNVENKAFVYLRTKPTDGGRRTRFYDESLLKRIEKTK